jgi:8-amino-7-oxononanoate synthase
VRGELRELGYDVQGDAGPIVPLVLGSESAALRLARALEARGVYAPAVRPPTVPPGACRLRLSVRANHTEAEIGILMQALRELRPADLVATD